MHMVIALLLAASTNLGDPLLTFGRAPSFEPREVKVEVGVLRAGSRSDFWLKRTVIQKKAKAVWWTDTVRCPTARSVLAEVRNLAMPRVSVPRLGNDELIITGDGVVYRLVASAEYPGKSAYDFEMRSNSDTPLARWVDNSLRSLEPCWTAKVPKPD